MQAEVKTREISFVCKHSQYRKFEIFTGVQNGPQWFCSIFQNMKIVKKLFCGQTIGGYNTRWYRETI